MVDSVHMTEKKNEVFDCSDFLEIIAPYQSISQMAKYATCLLFPEVRLSVMEQTTVVQSRCVGAWTL